MVNVSDFNGSEYIISVHENMCVYIYCVFVCACIYE